MSKPCEAIIHVPDEHCGCRLGLCPPGRIKLRPIGSYTQSNTQHVVWLWWLDFWRKWVPFVLEGRKAAVVFNGDQVDGVHHGTTTQISQNPADQLDVAERALAPAVEAAGGSLYATWGTPAHGGLSNELEETLARRIGCIPDSNGNYARPELWLRLGKHLVHILHHVGARTRTELELALRDAGQWQREPPTVIARGHVHRCDEERMPGPHGPRIAFISPGWQAKTPYSYRHQASRNRLPQFGGSIIRIEPDGTLGTYHYVKTITGRNEVAL